MGMSDKSGDDRLVGALARELRERERVRHESWEPVLLGHRSADEVARERLTAGDSPEEIELARALYEPPADAETERLFALMDTSKAGAAPAAAEPKPRGPLLRAAALALAFAAAALLMLWLHEPQSPTEAPKLALAPLPEYHLELDDGLATQRGDPEGGPERRYGANNSFSWIMRAHVKVTEPLGVRICARSEQGAELVIDTEHITIEMPGSGNVRLSGPIAALGLEPGLWTIVVVVGYASALDEQAEQGCALESPMVRKSQVEVMLQPS